MNGLESFSHSREQHGDCDRQEIAEHTPPKTENDERMVRIYRRILKIDPSFLRNMDLLQLIGSIRKEATLDVPVISSNQANSSASLKLDEFKE
jgi:hypothetical protein